MTMSQATQLFEALTETGMRPEAARRVERELQSSIEVGIARHHTDGHALLMTKADGIALENTLRAEMTEIKSELRQEMTEMKSELRQEMTEMKSELRSEMAEMKVDLRHEMAQIEARLMRHISDHGWKMMGFQVGVMGAMMGFMLTAFKYLH